MYWHGSVVRSLASATHHCPMCWKKEVGVSAFSAFMCMYVMGVLLNCKNGTGYCLNKLCFYISYTFHLLLMVGWFKLLDTYLFSLSKVLNSSFINRKNKP